MDVYLNIPDRDHILTAPSSPPVTIPAPSWLQRPERQAPRCASTPFSSLAVGAPDPSLTPPTSWSLPSADVIRKESLAPEEPIFSYRYNFYRADMFDLQTFYENWTLWYKLSTSLPRLSASFLVHIPTFSRNSPSSMMTTREPVHVCWMKLGR